MNWLLSDNEVEAAHMRVKEAELDAFFERVDQFRADPSLILPLVGRKPDQRPPLSVTELREQLRVTLIAASAPKGLTTREEHRERRRKIRELEAALIASREW